MNSNALNEELREFLQNELFARGIFKINGRHLYQCSLAEMNRELCHHREVKVEYTHVHDKKE